MKKLSAVFAVMMTSVTLMAETPVASHSTGTAPAAQVQQVAPATAQDPNKALANALNSCFVGQGAPLDPTSIVRSIGADTYRR